MRAFVAACVVFLACGEPVVPDPPLSVAIDGPAYAFVGESVCFRARVNGEITNATWTWGDGTNEAGGIEACHTFAYVGAHALGVRVERERMSASAVQSIAVVLRPSEPRPTWSSPIVHDGERVWVVNPDGDTIAVLRADPPELIGELAVGPSPRTLAVAEGVVAVACEDALYLIDAASLATLRTVALGVGTEPYGVLADPRGGAFVVSLRASGEIAVIALDGSVRARFAVGEEPRGLAMNAAGTLLVTRWRASVSGSTLYTVDLSDPPSIERTMLRRDEGMDSDTDNDGVLSFLNQIVPSPDGGRALLPALKANVVAGLARSGAPLTSQTTARAVLGEVTFGPPARESFRYSFDDLDYASAAVFSPYGDRVYVAMQGAQSIVAIDAYDFFSITSIDDAGEAPQGLAISPDGRLLYVQAFLSRSVRVYDVSQLPDPPLYAEVPTTASEPLAPDVLEGKRIFYRARDPRMSLTSYLACASCHLDGEGDSLVWDFTQRGEGLRNTIELRGRAGLAPLHWTANFDEVQDFEIDIRNGQGGSGFLSDAVFRAHEAPLGPPIAGSSAELDALAAYVSSLDRVGPSPRRRDGDAAWEASRARGEALFTGARIGCADCHAGPRFTDSAFVAGEPILHDVGTIGASSGTRLGLPLTGLDTPSLLGLWRSAPYLHDGSASTLRDVLVTRNPDDSHGRTSRLSASELDDLVVFLESLGD